jgi:hypothetical protein
MPLSPELLTLLTTSPPKQAWNAISEYLWGQFSAPAVSTTSDTEIVGRDKDLNEIENVLSGSAWELWNDFENNIPKASASLIEFWEGHTQGRAILILDGLSLRESPWLLTEATRRGFKIVQAGCRGSELPAETTSFAKALGFSQRSALENNGAGSSHKLPGAFTACSNLPWKECVDIIGAQEAFVFWHHWPDDRMHGLSGPGQGLRKLARETHAALTSDDFWEFVERLATGRRLVITGDHGYAACGEFHDLSGDQSTYMKKVFKSGRFAKTTGEVAPFVPPIDLAITSVHGPYQFVLGRRKWKSPSGYPTLQHGGLSLMEIFVPFLEIRKG